MQLFRQDDSDNVLPQLRLDAISASNRQIIEISAIHSTVVSLAMASFRGLLSLLILDPQISSISAFFCILSDLVLPLRL